VSDFYGEANRSGWLTAEESVLVSNAIDGVRLAQSRFSIGSNVKKHVAWTNYPDAVLKFRGLPTVVFEVGFSEEYSDLESDAQQWLQKACKKVQLVVLVDIQEDQPARKARLRTADAKDRLHNLLAQFGNQQAKERYGIEEGDEEVDEVHAEAVPGAGEDGMQLDGGTDYAAD
jgi:hypothetical protein